MDLQREVEEELRERGTSMLLGWGQIGMLMQWICVVFFSLNFELVMALDNDAVGMVDMVNLCCGWRRQKAVVVGGSAGSCLLVVVGCRRHCSLRERGTAMQCR